MKCLFDPTSHLRLRQTETPHTGSAVHSHQRLSHQILPRSMLVPARAVASGDFSGQTCSESVFVPSGPRRVTFRFGADIRNGSTRMPYARIHTLPSAAQAATSRIHPRAAPAREQAREQAVDMSVYGLQWSTVVDFSTAWNKLFRLYILIFKL